MTFTTESVGEQLAVLRQTLAELGGADITVLAVTKGFDHTAIRAALANDLMAVGENYAQELAAKAETISEEQQGGEQGAAITPQWHFIGQLQSNKVKLIAPHVSVWQSVDRLKTGRQIQNHAPGAQVFVQMQPPQIGADSPKAGAAPDDIPALVKDLRDLGLDVAGIMSVGVTGDPVATTQAFELAVALADDLDLAQRSLGMSGDLAIAVEAGSTMVRVGTGLFGPRPSRI